MNNEIYDDFSSLETNQIVTTNLIVTIIYPDRTVQKEIIAKEGQKINFGQSKNCDVIILDSSIAPMHFSFEYNGKIENIESYSPNTIYKEKENYFYVGLVKIKIEPGVEKSYLPINPDLFKIISEGFSAKKSILFLISLIAIFYFSMHSDNIFILNENDMKSAGNYFTFWILPNFVISALSVSYIIFTYFAAAKNQKFFTKIIQQYVLKYSIKLLLIYFLLNIIFYTLNGLFTFPVIYSSLLQGLLIWGFYLISKKIILLNQYNLAQNKRMGFVSAIFFGILFLFSHMQAFNTPYVAWIPQAPKTNIENSMELENKASLIVNQLKNLKPL